MAAAVNLLSLISYQLAHCVAALDIEYDVMMM